MKKLIIALTLGAFIAAPVYADYSEDRSMEISAGDIEILRIDCGAGFLEIEGIDGLQAITVEAEIFIDDVDDDEAEEIIEEYMELELNSRGGRARLVSKFENRGLWSKIFGRDKSAYINLTVKLPPNIELDIDDGSGYIDIRNIEDDVNIDDGSGEITAADIRGYLHVDDGSGEIIFSNIRGELVIDDGSGNVELHDIEGDIDLDDGSGNLEISDVVGNVDIDDGSGNIDIWQIDGSVAVDDGSGNIKIDEVSGDVRIVDDGSGHCSITNVDGEIDDIDR